MAKKKMKEWVGPHSDLVKIGAQKIDELFVIKLNGQTYMFGRHFTYPTEGRAKGALRKHLYENYLQGHYWHAKSDNSFSREKGWMHKGGFTDGVEPIMRNFANETLEWLLDQGIFTIEKINL